LADCADLRLAAIDGHHKILATGPDDVQHYSTETGSMLEDLEILVENLTEIMETFQVSSSPAPSPSGGSSSNTNRARLPKMELPKFNGDIKGWAFFRDLFKAQVHDVATITGVEKLNYLRSCLSSSTLCIIQNVPVSNDGYDTAWALLEKRFENKRESFFSVMKKFTLQPMSKEESSTSLRSLLDVTKETIRSLATVGVTVEGCLQADSMLLFHVVERLDASSRRKWISLLENCEIPTLDELLKFIEREASGLESVGSKPKSKTFESPHGKSIHAHHVQNGDKLCKICS